MPFKSEKQRKYLWANEPEIARDWTDTYGSRIHKAEGGGMKNIEGHDHMLAYITPGEAKSLEDMGGKKVMTPEGIPAYPPQGQSAQHGGRESSTTSSSGSTSGGGGHHSGGDHRRPTTYSKPKTKTTPPKGGYGQSNKNLDRGWGTTVDNFTKNQIDSFVRRNKAKNINQAIHGINYKGPLAAILSGLNTDDETDSYDIDSIREIASRFGGDLDKGQVAGLAGLRRDFEFEDKFTDPTTKQMRDFYNLDPPPTTGGEGQPYIWPPYGMASAPGETQSSGQSEFDKYLAGLGGDYQVPIEYVQNRTRAARGGVMDIEDRESIIKTPDEEIVTNQIEEIEGQTAGPAWFEERLNILMDLGYDYEIAGEIARNTPEYLQIIAEVGGFAQGGRVPAAYGGMMDTYTGRRKYGLGSFFKKITKPIKKIMKSPLGKAALIGGLGYLSGGAKFMGGEGMFTGGQGLQRLSNLKHYLLSGKKLMGVDKFDNPIYKNIGKGILKNPWVSIPAAGAAAGLYTAMKPPEVLDDAQARWDEDKDWWDAYYASLGEDNYRVPEEYILATGGRVGKQEGGLMDLGGMEKDYRNDGGFVPIGGEEKADDVPARLSRNEFVFTADAVRSAGGGDIDKGAEVMENVMKNLEAGGKVSEESQGKGGAQEMFEVSERLSEVM